MSSVWVSYRDTGGRHSSPFFSARFFYNQEADKIAGEIMQGLDELTWNRDGHGYNFSWKDVVDMPLNTFFFYRRRYTQHIDALNDAAKKIRNS